MPKPQVVEVPRASARLRNKTAEKQVETSHRVTGSTTSRQRFRYLVYPQKPQNAEINATPPAIIERGTSVPTAFTFFEKLPIELRQDIITLSLPGKRTVEFFPLPDPRPDSVKDDGQWALIKEEGYNFRYETNSARCQPGITTPVFLQVNRDCRAFCTRLYSPCFMEYTYNSGPIYVNFVKDTILMPFANGLGTFLSRNPRFAPGKQYLSQIQNLAVLSDYQFWVYKFSHFNQLTGLRYVTLKKSDTGFDSPADRKKFSGAWFKDAKNNKEHGKQAGRSLKLKMRELTSEQCMKAFNCDGKMKG